MSLQGDVVLADEGHALTVGVGVGALLPAGEGVGGSLVCNRGAFIGLEGNRVSSCEAVAVQRLGFAGLEGLGRGGAVGGTVAVKDHIEGLGRPFCIEDRIRCRDVGGSGELVRFAGIGVPAIEVIAELRRSRKSHGKIRLVPDRIQRKICHADKDHALLVVVGLDTAGRQGPSAEGVGHGLVCGCIACGGAVVVVSYGIFLFEGVFVQVLCHTGLEGLIVHRAAGVAVAVVGNFKRTGVGGRCPFHIGSAHSEGVGFSAGSIGTRPFIKGVALLCSGVHSHAGAVFVGTCAGHGFDAGVADEKRHDIAVSGVVILHHGAAVGLNGHGLGRRGGEAFIGLKGSRYRGIRFGGVGLCFKGTCGIIVVFNVLLIVLNGIVHTVRRPLRSQGGVAVLSGGGRSRGLGNRLIRRPVAAGSRHLPAVEDIADSCQHRQRHSDGNVVVCRRGGLVQAVLTAVIAEGQGITDIFGHLMVADRAFLGVGAVIVVDPRTVGAIRSGAVLITAVDALEGVSAVAVVIHFAGIAVFQLRDRLRRGLRCKSGIAECGAGEGLQTCVLAGRGCCHGAGGCNGFRLHMGCLTLTNARCGDAAVISGPNVGRRIPIVAGSIHVFHRLGLGGEGGVREGRGVCGFALAFAGGGIRDLTGRTNSLNDIVVVVVAAGLQRSHGAVIRGPGIGDRTPCVADGFKIFDGLGLFLEGRIREGCGVGRFASAFAGRSRCHFAGGGDCLRLHMGGVAAADTGRGHAAVVLGPGVRRCTPLVAEGISVGEGVAVVAFHSAADGAAIIVYSRVVAIGSALQRLGFHRLRRVIVSSEGKGLFLLCRIVCTLHGELRSVDRLTRNGAGGSGRGGGHGRCDILRVVAVVQTGHRRVLAGIAVPVEDRVGVIPTVALGGDRLGLGARADGAVVRPDAVVLTGFVKRHGAGIPAVFGLLDVAAVMGADALMVAVVQLRPWAIVMRVGINRDRVIVNSVADRAIAVLGAGSGARRRSIDLPFAPGVAGRGDHGLRLGDLGGGCCVAEILVAAGAVPVLDVAVHRAGLSLGGGVLKIGMVVRVLPEGFRRRLGRQMCICEGCGVGSGDGLSAVLHRIVVGDGRGRDTLRMIVVSGADNRRSAGRVSGPGVGRMSPVPIVAGAAAVGMVTGRAGRGALAGRGAAGMGRTVNIGADGAGALVVRLVLILPISIGAVFRAVRNLSAADHSAVRVTAVFAKEAMGAVVVRSECAGKIMAEGACCSAVHVAADGAGAGLGTAIGAGRVVGGPIAVGRVTAHGAAVLVTAVFAKEAVGTVTIVSGSAGIVVTQLREHPAVLFDHVVAGRVGEEFSAAGAGPVRSVTGLQAVIRRGGVRGHLVAEGSEGLGIGTAAAFHRTGIDLCSGVGAGCAGGHIAAVPGMGDSAAVLVAAVDALEGVGAVFAVVVLPDCAGVGVVFLGDDPVAVLDLSAAVRVGEVFSAFRAGPVRRITGCKAGGGHSVGLRKGMGSLGDLFGIGTAAAFHRTGVSLDADARAGRVGGHCAAVPCMGGRVAVLVTAVDALEGVGRVLAVAVAFDCAGVGVVFLGDDPVAVLNLVFAVRVGEELSADRAGPVRRITGRKAGGRHSVGLRKLMAGCIDDPVAVLNLVFAVRVGEELFAAGAGPVGRVARSGTGVRGGGMGGHVVAEGSHIAGFGRAAAAAGTGLGALGGAGRGLRLGPVAPIVAEGIRGGRRRNNSTGRIGEVLITGGAVPVFDVTAGETAGSDRVRMNEGGLMVGGVDGAVFIGVRTLFRAARALIIVHSLVNAVCSRLQIGRALNLCSEVVTEGGNRVCFGFCFRCAVEGHRRSIDRTAGSRTGGVRCGGGHSRALNAGMTAVARAGIGCCCSVTTAALCGPCPSRIGVPAMVVAVHRTILHAAS